MAVVAALAAYIASLVWPRPPAGQAADDRAAFAAWSRGPDAGEVAALRAFLEREAVADVVPLHEMLRGDVRRRRCAESRFAIPPRAQWRQMVPTLRYIRDHVIPAVGPVKAVSGYRDPATNRCFGGAWGSRHLRFAALDLVPVVPWDRAALVKQLCALHARTGERFAVGMGIYKGQRFHIDAAGFRRWGSDFRAASSPCRDTRPAVKLSSQV